MSWFLDFCSAFGFFAALAAFYKYFLPISFDKLINEFYTRSIFGKRSQSSVLSSVFIKHSTGKIFPGSIFSTKNILKMSAISLAFLIFFFIFYHIRSGKRLISVDWFDTGTYIIPALLGFFVIFNIICDVISFGFTVFLLRFCRKSQSFYDVIVFFVIDVVMTCYVFSWILALPAALGFYVIDAQPIKMDVSFSITQPPPPIDTPVKLSIVYNATLSVRFENKMMQMDELKHRTLEYQLRTDANTDFSKLIQIIEELFRKSILDAKVETNLRGTEARVRVNYVDDRSYWLTQQREERGFLSKIAGLYSIGYVYSLKSIEGFWIVLNLKNPMDYPLIYPYVDIPTKARWQAYCDGAYTSNDSGKFDDCRTLIALDFGVIDHLKRSATIARYYNIQIPLAVQFWTSLSSTLLLYLTLLMFIFGFWVFSNLNIYLLRMRDNPSGEIIFVRSILLSGAIIASLVASFK